MNVKDLAAEGVTLIPSTSADFDTQVSALIGTPSAASAPLLPYSVIVRNLTGQTIRGYALRWRYVDQNGNPDANYQVEQNFDPRQSGAEIPPGGGCVLSPFGPIRPSLISYSGTGTYVPHQALKRFANYASITVSLDAAAFDNGKVVGPNEGYAMDVWRAMYAAQRDVAVAAVQQALASSPDELMNWLTSQAAQPEVHPAGASMQERLAGYSHWYQIYARTTAQRLLDFSKQSVDSMSAEATRLAQTQVPNLRRR